MTTPGWISVKEQLPEDKQMCDVWDGEAGHAPVVARYIGGREFHDFFKNWVKVTHWMPRPDPPDADLTPDELARRQKDVAQYNADAAEQRAYDEQFDEADHGNPEGPDKESD